MQTIMHKMSVNIAFSINETFLFTVACCILHIAIRPTSQQLDASFHYTSNCQQKNLGECRFSQF